MRSQAFVPPSGSLSRLYLHQKSRHEGEGGECQPVLWSSSPGIWKCLSGNTKNPGWFKYKIILVSEAGRDFCSQLAPEATHKPRSRHLAHSLPCQSWRTNTSHHPVATLTPVFLPPKSPQLQPFPRHVEGQGQRKDKCFSGKNNLS